MRIDLDTICGQVREVAVRAGRFLKEERRKFDVARVEEKSAHNYVSYVDKACEQRIVGELSALLPEAGFITEEGSADYHTEQYCWLVDPLDGTTNYIQDMAPYCVSIALRKGDTCLLGVVYEVGRDECFHAVRGEGAWLDGQPIRVSASSRIDDAFVALGFPYAFDRYRPVAVGLVQQLYGHARGLRVLGSAAVELCYVACGRFDLRVEAFLGPWDVAAGGLIVEEAGGRITDFSGGSRWASGEEVVASNGLLHETFLLSLARIQIS